MRNPVHSREMAWPSERAAASPSKVSDMQWAIWRSDPFRRLWTLQDRIFLSLAHYLTPTPIDSLIFNPFLSRTISICFDTYQGIDERGMNKSL